MRGSTGPVRSGEGPAGWNIRRETGVSLGRIYCVSLAPEWNLLRAPGNRPGAPPPWGAHPSNLGESARGPHP